MSKQQKPKRSTEDRLREEIDALEVENANLREQLILARTIVDRDPKLMAALAEAIKFARHLKTGRL